MRFGIVPYTNSYPLVYGLKGEIFKGPPAQLISMSQRDDIVLAPVAGAFLDPSWHLISGVGIGSFGEVETVKLFFNKRHSTLQDVKTIYLDPESLTSQILLKILLQFHLNRSLSHFEFLRDKAQKADASLYIGDKVWEIPQGLPAIDLGLLWTNWTGLPFVFACWMTKNKKIGEKFKTTLLKNAKNNLGHLEKLSADFEKERQQSLIKYWRSLCYDLGKNQIEAINLFQKYWAKLENKQLHPLSWIY